LSSLAPQIAELALANAVDYSKFEFVDDEVVLAVIKMQRATKILDLLRGGKYY
jgi:hypothetical protein